MICPECGQTCIPDDAWTVRGRCKDCRTRAYGGDENHEPAKLFEPVPEPMPGQLDLDLS